MIDEARGNRLRFEYLTGRFFERFQRSILIDAVGLIATAIVALYVAAGRARRSLTRA